MRLSLLVVEPDVARGRPSPSSTVPELSALHIVASINVRTGGPAMSVVGLAGALTKAGVRARIATLDYREHGRQLDAPGVGRRSVVPSMFGKRLRGWSPKLGAIIADEASTGADIIHHHGLWMYPGIYARRVAARFGLPLVSSPRGMLDAWSLARGPLRKSLASLAYERRNLSAVRLFHATSDMEADAIRRYGLSQPIVVLPNGVDLPDLGSAAPRDALEAEFPALRSRRWLLFMGRLHAKKGLDLLLCAWSRLQAELRDWHLVIAGPDFDGYGRELTQTIRANGLADAVTVTGMLQGAAKDSALRNADLFILPTRSENFGIAVAEALAYGVPVITTRAAPWSTLVTHRCGWWITPDAAALEASIRTAVRLPAGELKAMGERGREFASARFSWEAIGARMADAYRWLLGRGPIPEFVRES
jgi:glycosyltransferase involved in cell wall biosynthesis